MTSTVRPASLRRQSSLHPRHASGMRATQSLGNDHLQRPADQRFALVAEHQLGGLIDEGDTAMPIDDNEYEIGRLGKAGNGALDRRIVLVMD